MYLLYEETRETKKNQKLWDKYVAIACKLIQIKRKITPEIYRCGNMVFAIVSDHMKAMRKKLDKIDPEGDLLDVFEPFGFSWIKYECSAYSNDCPSDEFLLELVRGYETDT